MGNGCEKSGDGWKYRGRGFIQVTGKFNYTECGKDLKLDLVNNPELLETSPAIVLSAGWFWNKHNLNHIADKEDIQTITLCINDK
jgi:putative chitinase